MWLTASYTLAGFGYIINMTFLPVMLRTGTGSSNAALTGWLIVGIAAMPATAIWVRLALRNGTYRTLITCTLVQAIGVALPVLIPGITSAFIGAALLGGTFMGIAGLAQWLARLPDPQASARRIGFITAFYGLGQIAGPLLVAWLDRGNDFTLPVLLAAAALLVSAMLLEVSRRLERLA
jgi:predicted MFS family arabinose efflux permease